MVKLVLFDCDGVLLNTEEVGYRIMNDMLAEHDVTLSREEFVQMVADTGYERFHDRLQEKHRHIPADFRQTLVQRLKEALDTEVRVIEGVKELLQNLKAHNIPFAVCSNSGAENLLLKLHKTGLFEHFVPHIYSRHHVENKKPAPDIYLLAAKNRGIDPKDCLVVDDSMTGTTAGARAGMTVIGFMGEPHRDSGEADYLLKAGARLIALSMEQVWEHIAHTAGLSAKKSPDFRP